MTCHILCHHNSEIRWSKPFTLACELDRSEIDQSQKQSECERANANWDLNESEIDLNECEHFLKENLVRSKQVWDRSKRVWILSQSEPGLPRSEIDLNKSEIDLNECEHFLKAYLVRSEIDPSCIDLSVNGPLFYNPQENLFTLVCLRQLFDLCRHYRNLFSQSCHFF